MSDEEINNLICNLNNNVWGHCLGLPVGGQNTVFDMMGSVNTTFTPSVAKSDTSIKLGVTVVL